MNEIVSLIDLIAVTAQGKTHAKDTLTQAAKREKGRIEKYEAELKLVADLAKKAVGLPLRI